MSADERGSSRAGMRAGDERGFALVLTLIVTTVVLTLGAAALLNTLSEMRTSDNFRKDIRSTYLAESGLDLVIGLQNDLTRSVRYLKNPSSYSSRGAGGAVLRDTAAVWGDPPSGGPLTLGSLRREVIGKDPVTTPPPYRIRSTAFLTDGNEAIVEADVDVISLKDFALFGQASLAVGSNITLTGRVYADGNIDLRNQSNIRFMREVETTGAIVGEPNATYDRGNRQGIPPYPPLTNLVDLAFFRNAALNAGVCGSGVGLHIGSDVVAVASQSANLFGLGTAYPSRIGTNPITGRPSTCNSGLTSCYQIDLTQFDLAADPITYGGRTLRSAGGVTLTPDNFNGVIYVNGQVHVWGILGGRSAEDKVVADNDGPGGTPLYNHPQGGGAPFLNSATLAANGGNFYSNNALDAGEDTNGNGLLDPARTGRSLLIVTPSNRDVVIDHNVLMGADTTGTRVSLGLIGGNRVYVDEAAPRTTLVEAAVIAMGTASGVWTVEGSVAAQGGISRTHPDNFWAKNGGDATAGSSYQFDLNQNGALEADNGDPGQPEDGQELAMLTSSVFRFSGSLVVGASPNTAAYTVVTPDRPRSYRYDTALINNEIPCYPTLPRYGVVPGTFAEVSR